MRAAAAADAARAGCAPTPAGGSAGRTRSGR